MICRKEKKRNRLARFYLHAGIFKFSKVLVTFYITVIRKNAKVKLRFSANVSSRDSQSEDVCGCKLRLYLAHNATIYENSLLLKLF